MTREQLLTMQAQSRIYQERADNAFASWGFSAPAMTLGADIDDYRRDLAVLAKKQLPEDHELRKIQYRALPDDAFPNFEKQLYAAVAEAGRRNDSVPYDAPLRMVETKDGNGMVVRTFLGQRHFVHDFKAPVRRVLSFTTDQGKWSSGRGWFA
jgi:hypothetical protein